MIWMIGMILFLCITTGLLTWWGTWNWSRKHVKLVEKPIPGKQYLVARGLVKRIGISNELQIQAQDSQGTYYTPVVISTSNNAASRVAVDFYGKDIEVSIYAKEVKR